MYTFPCRFFWRHFLQTYLDSRLWKINPYLQYWQVFPIKVPFCETHDNDLLFCKCMIGVRRRQMMPDDYLVKHYEASNHLFCLIAQPFRKSTGQTILGIGKTSNCKCKILTFDLRCVQYHWWVANETGKRPKPAKSNDETKRTGTWIHM